VGGLGKLLSQSNCNTAWSGIEPTTSRSRVRRANHSATLPPCRTLDMIGLYKDMLKFVTFLLLSANILILYYTYCVFHFVETNPQLHSILLDNLPPLLTLFLFNNLKENHMTECCQISLHVPEDCPLWSCKAYCQISSVYDKFYPWCTL
ncbi:hypothetical protein ElyMa_001629800, partial [Elysia marginata]